jgi:hypothetical protein
MVMNREEIDNIISKYEELIILANAKIKIIESLDDEYYTSRGIEDISFYNDTVSVRCDDTCRGCYDSFTFNLPIDWLTKTEFELKDIIAQKKELKAEKERIALKRYPLMTSSLRMPKNLPRKKIALSITGWKRL